MRTPWPDALDNPLWEFSLAAYRMDEVAPTCLALQDGFDVDVNLLLYAAWLAHLDCRLSGAHLREVDGRVADWREAVVKPLRALRRQLQGVSPAAEIRDEIKDLELRAERRQQDLMYRYYQRAPSLPRGAHVLSENLERVTRYCTGRESGWEEPVRRLHSLLAP